VENQKSQSASSDTRYGWDVLDGAQKIIAGGGTTNWVAH
jgi:hypothetical protein